MQPRANCVSNMGHCFPIMEWIIQPKSRTRLLKKKFFRHHQRSSINTAGLDLKCSKGGFQPVHVNSYLFLGYDMMVLYIGKDSRLHKVALISLSSTTRAQLGTFFLALFNKPKYFMKLLFTHLQHGIEW